MQTENQRERLVELLLKCDKESEVLDCFNGRPTKKQSADIIADYLMSNNVVVLPCVVGQTVWCIYNYEKPKEFQVSVLSMSENHYSFTIEANKGVFKHYCDKDAVGKWVFFTKEEAENVLKERNNGN